MINQPNNLFQRKINVFHFIIFGIFFVGFFMRIYGAKVLNITNSEAEILLSVTGLKPYETGTFFYELIIKLLRFIGINDNVGLRIFNVLIGSLIILLPAYFSEEIGKSTAILTSLFFAFDPFGIANSIVFSGNSLTILLVGLIIESIVHKRNCFVLMVTILIISQGRGLGYFVTTFFLFLIFLMIFDKKTIKSLKELGKELFSFNQGTKIWGVLLILVLILSLISKIPISSIATEIVNFISSWSKSYEIGNYPIVYPFSLFSYIPIVLFMPLIYFLKMPNPQLRLIKLSYLWMILAFLIITFYPRHLIIDLVWVSLPLWLIMAILINSIFTLLSQPGEVNLPFLTFLLATGLCLVINIISLVNRFTWGMETSKSLLIYTHCQHIFCCLVLI